MFQRTTLILSTLTLCLLGFTIPAQAITQNLAWVGSNGHTMEGTFSYDAASAGDGLIEEGELTSLLIEGSQYGASIGTWDIASGGGVNFNFDTTTNTFLVGGTNLSGTGQSWNFFGNPGLGFGSGNTFQSLTLDGSNVVGSPLFVAESTLTASAKNGTAPIPEPSTMLLFGTGLVGLIGLRYWKGVKA